MQKYDANSWEDYTSYTLKKKREEMLREQRATKKKNKERVLRQHNSSVKGIAKKYANDMQKNPSELEKRMKDFLDNKGVVYDFQRVFNIKDKKGKIKKFFIADFYIPSCNLIIETDGKFHEDQSDYDEIRTQLIQHFYPNVKVLRWRWHDFESLNKMRSLISILR